MIDPENVPPIAQDEMLARFVFFRDHLRSNGNLKPNAFMPPPDLELSVTRHLMTSESELWAIGMDIGEARQRPLIGRGDVSATVCLAQNLTVNADPLAENPNHAAVRGWPVDKPAQKNIALEMAANAMFVELSK